MDFTLEVIAFNIESCLLAGAAGAHRIELCAGPGEGGTTPSYGFIKAAREISSLEIYPIIRPRGGDFLYNHEEFEIMKQDVLSCKRLGCDGIVMGMLQPDGSVEKDMCSILVELAYPLGVTFHRAFDRTNNPFKAMEDIIDIGCERILTSGQMPTALEGAGTICNLIGLAKDRIIIMPGSGIRSGNIIQVASQTKASEFHSSARISNPSAMKFTREELRENLATISLDEEEIKSMLSQLTDYKA